MSAFVIYLIKVNLGIAFLYAIYYLLLRKEKFFRLNRVILLSIVLLAFLLPLLPSIRLSESSPLQHGVLGIDPFSDFTPLHQPGHHLPTAGHGETEVNLSTPVMLSSPWGLQEIFEGVYILIALVLTGRLLMQLVRLRSIIGSSHREKRNRIIYCCHDQQLPPFSFFHYLVLNPLAFQSDQLEQIVLHEKAHIEEGHTLDLLLMECLRIFFWINPCIIGLQRSVKLNLEYLADEKVLRSGADAKAYQYSILSYMRLPALPLTNQLTSSKIKLRVNMMNTKKTPRRNLYKYALAIPLLACTWLMVAPVKANTVSTNSRGILQPASQDLKAFEGYYQFSSNADAYIQITASGKQLILKQLWDNKEIRFDQQSALTFSGDEGHFPLKFSKNAEGAIISVLAFDKDLWNKVNEYKPVATIRLPESQMKSFKGVYEMMHDGKPAYIQILTDENALILRQGWDGREIAFQATSATSFYSKENAFPLQFTKDNSGKVLQVTAFNKDVWTRMDDPAAAVIKTGMPLDEGQLRPIEGKYHMSAEGKELYIELTQENHGLLLKQSWDGKTVRLTAESPTSFFSKDRPFSIVFTLDNNGIASSALAFGKDHWDRVKE